MEGSFVQPATSPSSRTFTECKVAVGGIGFIRLKKNPLLIHGSTKR